jgi:WD40 repeat protein/Flp pilus assembly protein TadD
VLHDRAELTGLTFRPDDRQVALADRQGAIRLFDLPSGQMTSRLPSRGPIELPPYSRTSQVRFGDVHLLGIRMGSEVQVRDVRDNRIVATLKHSEAVHTFAWHPDGRTLASTCHGETSPIYLWDVLTAERRVLQGHIGEGKEVCFHPSEELLLSVGPWGQTRCLWHPRTGELLVHSHGGIMFWPQLGETDGLAVRGKLWEVAPGREYRTLVPRQAGAKLSALAIHPGGRLLAVGSDRGVLFWDLLTQRQLDALPLPGSTKVVFAGNDLLTQNQTGTLRWPVREASPGLYRIGPPRQEPVEVLGNVDFSASSDGKVVAWANPRRCALLRHDSRPGRLTVLGPQADVRSVYVSPDGQYVATGSWWGPGSIKVWDAASGKAVREWTELGKRVEGRDFASSVAFSPDGRFLAGGAYGEQVAVWRVRDLQRLHVTEGGAATFSPDGTILAVGNDKGVIRLLRAESGEELARLEARSDARADRTRFSPDGTQLVVLSYDHQAVHIWDLRKIRAELARLGLDWDAPPYRETASPPRVPIEAQVVGVELADRNKMAEHDRARAVSALYFNPFDADAHYRLGKRLLESGNLERAHAHLGTALAFRPNLNAALYPRARAALGLRRWQAAHADFTRHLALYPEDNEAHHQRGHVNEQLHRYAEAIADFTGALERQPGDSHLLDCRGENYLRLGRHAEAAADCRASLKASQEQDRPNRNLAWIHVNGPDGLRDPVKALPLAQRAVALGAKESRNHHTLGVVYYRLGRWKDAVASFERGLELRGGESTAYYDYFLAMCRARMGDLPQARERYRQAVKWADANKALAAVYIEELKAFRAEAEQVLGK